MGKAKRGYLEKIMVIGLVLIMLTGLFTSSVYAEEEEDLAPHCKAAILYEATTDTVLYAKNPDMQLPPASMTKVMTAILVLEENPNLEGEFTVDKRAVGDYYCPYKEQSHLKAGEVISYEECMKYLLIPSGNEAASAFAFDRCDEYQDFIDLMNAKAKELGCENTNYRDCIGFADIKHYTTPADMVKIADYAMQFPKFRECVSQSKGEIPASNMRDKPSPYETTNYVMFPDDRYISPYSKYMTGVKTGYTPAAGWCFTGCMEKDGLVFYSVAMGGDLLDYSDGERVIQGDFLDTINMYRLTDGLTAENIGEKYPKSSTVGPIVIAVIAVVGIVILLYRKHRKKSCCK